jgi:hypothetical protein
MTPSGRILFLLSAALMLSQWSCTNTERQSGKLQDYLEDFREEYIGDTRTTLWKMAVKADREMVLEGYMADADLHEKLRDEVSRDFPKVAFRVRCLPEEGIAAQVNGLANNSVIHLRRDPSSKTELVTQALLGTPLTILVEVDGKSLIQVPDGYLGWVNTPEVYHLEEDELEAYAALPKIIFTETYGFAYSEPSLSSLPVSDLVIGAMLAVEAVDGDFYKVIYPDHRIGWVLKKQAKDALEVLGQDCSVEGLLSTALRYHGIPYLWGGASAKNIDCSGLISNVFFMNGMQLPRDTDMQSSCGREVSKRYDPEGLAGGDLLFFGSPATAHNEERINHVALYLGGGEFIHAAGYRERVSINSMDSLQASYIPEYPDIFVRAIRILGEEGGDAKPVLQNVFYQQIFSHQP